jgi:hypothetical protein
MQSAYLTACVWVFEALPLCWPADPQAATANAQVRATNVMEGRAEREREIGRPALSEVSE